MTDWIIPIKCSTVKTIYHFFKMVNIFLIGIYCIISWIYAAMLIVFDTIQCDGVNGFLMFMAGYIGVGLSIAIILIACIEYRILEKLPHLKCIED